jgi:hypothetical protein
MAAVTSINVVRTKSPPDVPAGIPLQMANHLRTLATWAHQQLQDKVSMQTATSNFLLISPGQKVFSVSVDDSGALVTTQVLPGSHP